MVGGTAGHVPEREREERRSCYQENLIPIVLRPIVPEVMRMITRIPMLNRMGEEYVELAIISSED
jgi:hypothetical protein